MTLPGCAWPAIRLTFHRPLSLLRCSLALLCLAAAAAAAQAQEEHAEVDFVLTEADRAWLTAHRVIRVGAEINYAPYEFQDSRGRFTGVVADYLDLVRSRLPADLGVRFEVRQQADFDGVEKKLHRHELDIVMALTPTRERDDYLLFTKPYLQYVNVIVTRDDHEFVTGMADFAKKRIAVVRGHSAEQLVARSYPQLQVTPYSDILDALIGVSTGREDGLVDDIFPIVYNIRQRQIGNLKLATPFEKSLQPKGFSIAVRKDWGPLVGLLDRVLETVTQEEQRAISQKWLSLRYESKIDYRIVWTTLAVLLAVLFIGFVWIRQLNIQRAALEAARAQAEAANRAKDNFLASMSHELRTPLHAILGYADLLRQDRLGTQARRDALATVAGSGRHLLSLINDLLDLSRIRSGHLDLKPVEVALPALLDEVAAMIRVEASRKDLEFVVQIASGLPAAVKIDDKRFRQVLLNLLGNAIKFTDQGAVTFAVRGKPAGEGLIELQIAVEDTGPGIDPADNERIFMPFEQAEEGRKRESGVGLGLAISHEIVERMQGVLSVASRPGAGSRFDLTLVVPIVHGAPVQPVEDPVIVGFEGTSRRILVVDDHAENTALIEGMLAPIGFEVKAAGSGEAALSLVETWRPDLVLMDLRMPEMNGFETAEALQRQLGDQPLPIIASSASMEDLERAREDAGRFTHSLRKPFELRELLGVLGEQLHLRWKYATAVVPHAMPVTEDFSRVRIPADRLRAIREYAQLGKWVRIEQVAHDLEGESTRYVPFAQRLLAIAHDYDDVALAHLLQMAEASMTEASL